MKLQARVMVAGRQPHQIAIMNHTPCSSGFVLNDMRCFKCVKGVQRAALLWLIGSIVVFNCQIQSADRSTLSTAFILANEMLWKQNCKT